MRHAVIAPSRSEARLGLRQPTVAATEPSSGGHAAPTELDAPTVELRRPAITEPRSADVFSGRDRIVSRDGSGRSPHELWASASPRRRVAAVAAAAVALVALGSTFGHSSSSTSSSSSTTSTATTTTPLRCEVHDLDLGEGHTATQTDDPLCTQKELAARLCDLDLGDNPAISASGMLQSWYGRAGQAALLTTRDSFSFRCVDYAAGSAHSVTFDDGEWSELLKPGTMSVAMSRRLAYA